MPLFLLPPPSRAARPAAVADAAQRAALFAESTAPAPGAVAPTPGALNALRSHDGFFQPRHGLILTRLRSLNALAHFQAFHTAPMRVGATRLLRYGSVSAATPLPPRQLPPVFPGTGMMGTASALSLNFMLT
ncbi:hypothetical protein AURDEDRAFT_165790 [Auricularia subglabra TFB-10046 SS5]|nr:hypothetical protein AURDEDRAFT_165790 [Auricularia subglabra TFB-10046 SS5]